MILSMVFSIRQRKTIPFREHRQKMQGEGVEEGSCQRIHRVTEGETRWSPPVSGEVSDKETGTDPVEGGTGKLVFLRRS